MKFIILILLLFNIANSKEPKAVATASSNNITIGENIILNLEIISSNKYEIIFPNFQDTLSSFEILGLSKIDTIIENGDIKLKQEISLIHFDSGRYNIPSLKFVYKNIDDTNKLSDFRTFSTNSIPIFVNTIEIDTTQSFKDIKPLIDAPFTIWEIIDYIYLGLILILLAILGWYLYNKYLKNRQVVKEEVIYDPKIPADILALEALRKLKDEKIWQQNEFKLYYTKLTDILRIYILRVFNINALDMTSSEIIESLKNMPFDENIKNELKYILTNSDLVKFAKEKPIPEVNEKVLDYGFSFVEKTKSFIKKEEEEEE
jgi:hypothetical protein